MSRCGACGSENPAAKRFCGDCGSPLSLTCPECGAAIESGKRFCGDCGASLARSTAPVGDDVGPRPVIRSVQVAERRVCSVLFVDLVGFTPLSETRDPEDVRELLSRYFEEARTIIGRYGGVVEKFIGDAVMAVWGTPIATEGDAERSVRAALDVVTAVAALGQEVGAPGLAARAGVATGEVAVTHGTAGEGVAGDTVNTASRVQSIARSGRVWVDAGTHRLAGAAVGFADAGEHELKGKTEPIRLWEATRVLSGVGGDQRGDGLEASLFGRDAELRTVKELFHASADRRTPRLVVVSGPAGVGKSRLGWEFEKYTDGLADPVYWHRGRCLSYGEGIAFWALAGIIRQRFGIAEEDPLDLASARLSEGLRDMIANDDDRRYIGPRLGRLLGLALPDDAEGDLAREELFAGWRYFFERLADVQPVVILIEDAQYGDAALLDFVDHLVDWARDSPIFVLVFARPDLEQVRPGFGVGRNRSTLTLDPLDDSSMDNLINALVPGMPQSARSAIRRQAEGIPLFAVETVRSLVDRGVVVPYDGVYQLVGELGELSVPAGLHALLAARLDALDPDLRTLVAEAAVLGSSFPAEALVAVSTQPESVVMAGLTELLRREVLSVSADRGSPQRGDYRFAQDLLRQVAYETSSRRDRRSRHLAVAAHLRSAFPADGDEVAEIISRHYLDALAAVPDAPDVAEVRSQAINMLVRAADRALRAGAPSQAASSYAQAAEQTESISQLGNEIGEVDQDAAGLWEKAARSALTANLDDTIAYAERACELYLLSGHPRAAARAQSIAGEFLGARRRHGEARERLGGALETLRADPDADTLKALHELARVEIMSGGPDAERLTSEALLLGQSLDIEPGLLADLLISRAVALAFTDRFSEAVAFLEYAAGLAEKAGDSGRQARAMLNLGEILTRRDPSAAASAAHKAAALARNSGNVLRLDLAQGNEMQALMLLGEWDRAQELVLDADELGKTVTAFAAILAALRGDHERAARYEQLPDLRNGEDIQDKAFAHLVDALIASTQHRDSEALGHARAVLSELEHLGIGHFMIQWAWTLAIRTAQALSEVEIASQLLALLDSHPIGHLSPLLRGERALASARLAAVSNISVATPDFDSAIAALRHAGSPYHLAQGLLDEAEYLAGERDSQAVMELVSEARTIGEKLSARPLLERCDQVLALIPATA